MISAGEQESDFIAFRAAAQVLDQKFGGSLDWQTWRRSGNIEVDGPTRPEDIPDYNDPKRIEDKKAAAVYRLRQQFLSGADLSELLQKLK